jgi:hypothetical protein
MNFNYEIVQSVSLNMSTRTIKSYQLSRLFSKNLAATKILQFPNRLHVLKFMIASAQESGHDAFAHMYMKYFPKLLFNQNFYQSPKILACKILSKKWLIIHGLLIFL